MVPEVAQGSYELKEASTQVARQNVPIDGLPVELLFDVFHYVVPPSTLLEPVFRGSCTYTSWMAHAMEAKLTISQVNRHWNSVVQPLLYVQAPLHCSVQVQLFADALRGNPSLRSLLRKLVFHCFASTVKERDSLVSNLVFILTQCTGLRTVVFTDALFANYNRNLPKIHSIPAKITDVIEALHGTLTRFEHWPKSSYAYFPVIWPLSRLATLPLLTTLAIHVDHPAALERIVLESLEELDLSRDYTVPLNWDRSKHFLSWELPRLRRLVLPERVLKIHSSFLRRFGQRVIYPEFRDRLNMHVLYTVHTPDGAWFDDPTRLCPRLEHLVYHAHNAPALQRLVNHPTLAYIDVWARPEAECPICRAFVASMEEAIPSDARWKNM